MRSEVDLSLSKKLVAAILAISSCVTLFVTAAQLAFDFHQDVSIVDQNLDLIKTTHLSSVTKSIWDMDEAQLKIQLAGLLTIPGVEHVEIVDHDKTVSQIGAVRDDGHFLDREFQLQYDNDGQTVRLGTLRVRASIDQIYTKIYDKIFVIFFTQFLKTLLVSFLIFMLIKKLLIRNLFEVTEYLSGFDSHNAPPPLELKRGTARAGKRDEFDVLVGSVNKMRANLVTSHNELLEFARTLERQVDEKTNVIIEQRQALEHSAKMTTLGEMAGGVAHEINTPLAIIQMRSDQLRESIEDGDFDESFALEASNSISSTVDRIAKIVSGLKAFAREGRADPMQQVRLVSVIEDALTLCREKFSQHGVRLDFSSFADAEVKIECRAVEISQVLLNLMNNAYDAVETLPEKWIRIEIYENGYQVEICVTDSGAGIPSEIRAKIMQPFFSTKPVGKGTGLGLSISKGIVEAHNGKILIDEASPNTRFVLRLPKAQTLKSSLPRAV